MSFPKWKYRRHPVLNVFQSTLVANSEAETELGAEWSDNPEDTGFAVRAAGQIHPSHIASNVLHEAVSDASQPATEAKIDAVMYGDTMGSV